MKNTNKGYTLIEIIIAISLFTIFLTGRFIIDNNLMQNYRDFSDQKKIHGLVDDIYAYLYSYKKTYGTYTFNQLITQGDQDRSCNGNDYNGNGLVSDSIDEYCFFYPYINNDVLDFVISDINSTEALYSEVFILSNTQVGFNGDSYKRIYNQDDKLITIALKQSNLNEDKYSGFIGIYSPSMLGYIYKQKIVLE